MVNQQRLVSILDNFAYVLLLATIIVVPLFVDNNLANWYVIPKQYVLGGLVLLQALTFAGKAILSKRLVVVRSMLDTLLLILLVLLFLSAVFSGSVYDSFFGRNDSFVLNFSILGILILFFFLTINQVGTLRRWLSVNDIVLTVGGCTALLFILKIVFHIDLLSRLGGSIWNTVDITNTNFGIWLIAIFLLAAGRLIKRDRLSGRSLGYFFVALLSYTSLILLGFQLLWWIAFVGLLIVLCLGVSFVREARVGWLSALFAILLLTAIFIVFGTPQAFKSSVPTEVALNVSSSWGITHGTALKGVKNFFLGSGLGTFGIDFSEFRDAEFNNDSVAWTLRFNRPMNTLFAWLAEAGVPAFVLLVFIVIIIMGHVLASWLRQRSKTILDSALETDMLTELPASPRLEVFIVAGVWLTVTAASLLTFFGPVLWWLWWLLLALTIIGVALLGGSTLRIKELSVEGTPEHSLTFSFGIIVVIAVLLLGGVWGARLYLAEIAYALALRSTDYPTAEANLTKALGYRSNSDVYHMALAQVYLLEAVQASRMKEPKVVEVSALLGKAVNEARVATTISPRSVAIWENLATMYENAAPVVAGAREWALQSLQEAIALEPTNPILHWRLGNNFGLARHWEEAVKLYQQAVDLKADYLAGYFGLATAYEQLNQIDKAVAAYQTGLSVANTNVDLLFNYGRVLFNRNGKGDRDQAQKIWLAVIQLQPKYVNALYSLGLWYEAKGDKTTALQYYYKVKDLNPTSKEVADKIATLTGPAALPSAEEQTPPAVSGSH